MPDIKEHIRRIEQSGTPPVAESVAEFMARGGKVDVIEQGVKTMDMANVKYGAYQSKIAGALRRELG